MQASEIREKTVEELGVLLENLRKEQFNLLMQKAMGQLSKPDQIRKVRRTIARVLTIMSEKRASV